MLRLDIEVVHQNNLRCGVVSYTWYSCFLHLHIKSLLKESSFCRRTEAKFLSTPYSSCYILHVLLKVKNSSSRNRDLSTKNLILTNQHSLLYIVKNSPCVSCLWKLVIELMKVHFREYLKSKCIALILLRYSRILVQFFILFCLQI